MKIAIWGSYNYGNYGDDIMAVQFANHIKELGAIPIVYRLDRKLAEQYQILTTASIDELLDNAKFCIIGGGGMLVGESKKKKAVDRAVDDAFDDDFKELYEASVAKQCQVFPISVGGDGRGEDTPLPLWRNKFWSGVTCSDSTVRLKQDISLVKKLGKNATYYPDVLFSVADFWKIAEISKSETQVRVGINLMNSRKTRLLALLLNNIASIKKNIVFYFIRSSLPNYTHNRELLPQIDSPYIKHYIHSDPLSTLELLNSLDLIVSHKLHLGLTALSLNVPFYSWNSSGKTKTFLNSIDASSAIYKPKDIVRLIANITSVDRILQAKTKFNFAMLEQYRVDSHGHMNFLKDLIERHTQ